MIGCMQLCSNATVQIEYSKSTCFLLQVYVDPGLVGISGEAEERKTTETGTKGQRECFARAEGATRVQGDSESGVPGCWGASVEVPCPILRASEAACDSSDLEAVGLNKVRLGV